MKVFSQVLEKMGDRRELHAKFLNTLSLLEFIGARKIVKSQIDRDLTEELLSHIAEEVRHSLVLKHLVLKLSENQFSSYEEAYLLGGIAGKAYIQTVDRAVENLLPKKNEWKNYLLTTLLVEERAASVYPIYNEHLARLNCGNKLISIIRDEDKHLQAVLGHLRKTEPEIDFLVGKLRSIESAAFEQFMNAVLSSLG